MRQISLILLGLLLLASCGRRPEAPESIHTQWVEAMRSNNRQALLALMVEGPLNVLFVDDSLRAINDKLRNAPYGPLTSVELLPLQDDPEGKQGISVWRFERRRSCYHTILTTYRGAWKVTRWGLIAKCPAGVK